MQESLTHITKDVSNVTGAGGMPGLCHGQPAGLPLPSGQRILRPGPHLPYKPLSRPTMKNPFRWPLSLCRSPVLPSLLLGASLLGAVPALSAHAGDTAQGGAETF